MAPKRALVLHSALLALAACDPPGLPPVDQTAPSQDQRILRANGTMSDGSPVPSHRTETIPTSIEIVSRGAIGGTSVDAQGNVYNANFNHGVWKTAPGGETVLLNGEFQSASGNLPLPDGDLLQADYKENIIYRISPSGIRAVYADSGLDGPVGMTRLPSGDLVVANYRGRYLARVPAGGGVAEPVIRDDRMQRPNGLTLDPDGNIYVADLETGSLFKLDPGGNLTVLAELPGKGNAHVAYTGGALYVNKIWDHVVYFVDPATGAYGIVTGNGHPGYDDGPTGVATVEEPNGIAAAPGGGAVYFNTHRGRMGGDTGTVVLRRLVRER